MQRPRRRVLPSTAVAALVTATLVVAGCGGKSSEGKPGRAARDANPKVDATLEDEPSAEDGAPTRPQATLQEKVDPAVVADALGPCDLLTPTIVAEVLEVSTDSLRQAPAGGCAYTVTSPDQEISASLRQLAIGGDGNPAGRFAMTTRSITKKDAEEISKRMAEKAAARAGKAGVEPPTSLPEVPEVKFEDVEGVGDAARLNTTTGDLHVLTANIIFVVNAFKGDRAPRPASAAEARQARAKHIAKTIGQRRDTAIKLAKAVIAHIPEVTAALAAAAPAPIPAASSGPAGGEGAGSTGAAVDAG